MNGFYDEVSVSSSHRAVLTEPLVEFSDTILSDWETQDTITKVFSGTVLQDPALGLIYVRRKIPL